jgi:hypothetical protein
MIPRSPLVSAMKLMAAARGAEVRPLGPEVLKPPRNAALLNGEIHRGSTAPTSATTTPWSATRDGLVALRE